MADNSESLILKVEAKGATEATVALKALDAVAAKAEVLLTGLTATSATLSASMTALSGATYFATAGLHQNTAAAAANSSVTSANTAATISNTAALTALAQLLMVESAARASNTAALTTNTAATTANTAGVAAQTVATEASAIATEVLSVANAAAAAALASNTTATVANTAAVAAGSVAQATNTTATTATATATTAATVATTTSIAARLASTIATIAGTVAAAALTAGTWLLTTAIAALTAVVSAGTAIVGGFTALVGGLAMAFVGLLAPLTAILTPLYVFKKLVEGTRVYQDFQAQLEVVTGSATKAAQAYAALVDYAIQTPYGLKQATDGFVKLVNFGLDPSEKAMRALGNIAAGTAREFDQMVQAVAMATVNNFVRLKQFGILGRKAGDDVIFTFQGVTTKVKANAKEIQGYLLNLGETAFAGAMERRMQSLSGVLSNLGDAWSLFWQAVAKQGPDAVLTKSFKAIETALVELTTQMESGQFTATLEAYAIAWSRTFQHVSDAIEFGKEVVREGIDWIAQYVTDAGVDWNDLWKYFPIYAGEAIDTVIAYFKYWSAVSEAETKHLTMQIAIFWEQVKGYVNVFVTNFTEGWRVIREGLNPVVEAFTRSFAFILNYATSVGEDIKRVWDVVYESVSAVATAIAEWFKIQFDKLVGYAAVAADAVANAFKGVMPNVAEGLKAVTDKAIAATENFQKNLSAGVEKIGSDLQAITDSSNTRYETAAKQAAASAEQAAANLRLEKATIDASSEALKKEYDAKMSEADRLRKEYDAKIAGQKGSGFDRLAEFEKSGNGEGYNGAKKSGGGRSSVDREAKKAEQDAKRLLDVRLRLVESGMKMENQVISDAYEERKRQILENEKLTIAEREALVLTALNDNLLTEEQAIKESYDRRHAIIMEATELTETQRNDLLGKLTKARASAEGDEEYNAQMKRQSQWSEFFGNINEAASAFGKKGFAIAKAAAIAKTTVDTASAAMAAYKDGGGYYGAALAAAAIAAGSAQIAVISQTQYQGAYEHGGMISAGKYGLVGEAGPEFVKGPAVVTSAATTRNNGSLTESQGIQVIVQNMGQPMSATSDMSEGRLRIILKPILEENRKQTQKEIAGDIQRGGGMVSTAIEKTYAQSRSRRQSA